MRVNGRRGILSHSEGRERQNRRQHTNQSDEAISHFRLLLPRAETNTRFTNRTSKRVALQRGLKPATTLGNNVHWGTTFIGEQRSLGNDVHWGTTFIGERRSLGNNVHWGTTFIGERRSLGNNVHWGTTFVLNVVAGFSPRYDNLQVASSSRFAYT